ncbi:MAG: T9SS type A sorting domain-containing protein [Candidatus Eisenbacteria sp.]|nr:T9SS type A sorting domain-containing protein [Candidatus Eisenbacteria bacterium]
MNRQIVLRSFILLTLCGPILPQASAAPLWTQTYGGSQYDWGRMVQQTDDGGYVIVGDTYSFGVGSYDVWLIKTDADGDILWTATYGGINEERGYSVQQTTDGGYIIAGTTCSYGAGTYDVWLVRADTDGTELWAKTFGGTSWDWGWSAQQTQDGGYIITGYTESYGPGVSAVWLIKTDEDGNSIWTKTFGGSSSDYGCSVQQTSDEGYIIVGDTYSYGAGSRDIWLIRTNSDGDSLWTRTFGGSSSDGATSVRQTEDGGHIVTGYTKSFGAGEADVWTIKTDCNGATVWAETYGGAQSDYGSSVRQTVDGGYFTVGYTESYGAGNDDVWLIRTASNGDTLWTETYGGSNFDRGRSGQETLDGGYIVVGETYSFEEGEYNVLLMKFGGASALDDGDVPHAGPANMRSRPNPFSRETSIIFESRTGGRAELEIYDIGGRLIRVIDAVDAVGRTGETRFVWDGRDQAKKSLPVGVYLYRIAGDRRGGSHGRVVLAK